MLISLLFTTEGAHYIKIPLLTFVESFTQIYFVLLALNDASFPTTCSLLTLGVRTVNQNEHEYSPQQEERIC